MAETGIISEMREKGIKWIFIGSVDNVLLNMVDPILIGLTINQNNEIASKSIAKKIQVKELEYFVRQMEYHQL